MSDRSDSMASFRYRRRPVSLIVTAAVIGIGVLWFVLAVVTALVFHFMPAAPIIAAVWVRRSFGPDQALAWGSLLAHIAGGLLTAAITGAALAAVNASMDALWQVATVVLAGTGIAIWLGRRIAG